MNTSVIGIKEKDMQVKTVLGNTLRIIVDVVNTFINTIIFILGCITIYLMVASGGHLETGLFQTANILLVHADYIFSIAAGISMGIETYRKLGFREPDSLGKYFTTFLKIVITAVVVRSLAVQDRKSVV